MSSSTQTAFKDSKELINEAGKLIDKFLKDDKTFYDLSGLLGVTTDSMQIIAPCVKLYRLSCPLEHANLSGHLDSAYPALSSSLPALAGMPFLGEIVHTPLPQELLHEFESIRQDINAIVVFYFPFQNYP